MKHLILASCAAIALAAAVPAEAAQQMRHFNDWAVAHYTQKGKRICYAYTQQLAVHHTGGACDVAVLVVTHAPPRRDRVVVSPCAAYDPNQPKLTMQVDQTGQFGFHAQGKYAYADRPAAAIAAFKAGNEVHMPAPPGHMPERFSLRGFTAAYDALSHSCG
ncbi:invasion associated locus B family protein [Acidisoma sp. C75]